jgi:hypothetical protein
MLRRAQAVMGGPKRIDGIGGVKENQRLIVNRSCPMEFQALRKCV